MKPSLRKSTKRPTVWSLSNSLKPTVGTAKTTAGMPGYPIQHNSNKGKITPSKSITKSEFVTALVKKSGLTKTQAVAALAAVNEIVAQQLGKKGPGEVILPGLLKLSTVVKPATKKHEGINPFTKMPMTYQAKPARRVIKARALKALNDAI
jgi:nucleoid DNA-binding protein